MIVVSDTSPLRALDHLGLTFLPQDLYGEVLIPPAVEVEFSRPTARNCHVAMIAPLLDELKNALGFYISDSFRAKALQLVDE